MERYEASLDGLMRAFIRPRGIVATVCAAVVGAVCWLAWLPWHAHKHLNRVTLAETGPYTRHQVEALIVTVCVIAVVGGWFRLVLATGVGVAFGMTVTFSADAITQVSPDANLWPIGAAFLWVGAATGLCLVAYASLLVRVAASWLSRWRSLRGTG